MLSQHCVRSASSRPRLSPPSWPFSTGADLELRARLQHPGWQQALVRFSALTRRLAAQFLRSSTSRWAAVANSSPGHRTALPRRRCRASSCWRTWQRSFAERPATRRRPGSFAALNPVGRGWCGPSPVGGAPRVSSGRFLLQWLAAPHCCLWYVPAVVVCCLTSSDGGVSLDALGKDVSHAQVFSNI